MRQKNEEEQIEGLFDGIFAIAMTLLVLGIEVPEGIITESPMASYLTLLAPRIYIYCLSFLLCIFLAGLTTCNLKT